ncbi:hypothetical protein Poli38472_011862 [Pythium oligandrum]|uniref:Uncharacterized protein n=1 Tax=Pythium oligandrum TaxID=41045 RepID=A0A8K1FET3_PYTOL|nr:hypothetical protein Poli38472_011862 [Pythium oligandrum]|eukprot:TMW58274.1 hypothetical protein Poli38472_011862 [Pythium oligandrum]
MTTLAEELALFGGDMTHEETLNAALAMIDEFDFDPSDSLTQTLVANDELLAQSELFLRELPSDSSSPSSPSTSATAGTSSPGDASATDSVDEAETDAHSSQPKRRQTKREQLIELRTTVQHLESKLDELRESKRSPDDELWKAIVTTQLMERQRAEKENARLRSMLDEHVNATQHLEQALFRKRPSPEPVDQTSSETESSGTAKRVRSRKGISHLDDPAIEKELLGIVDTMYADVEKILNSRILKGATGDRRRVSEIRADESTGGTILEAVDARIYPFEYQATAEIMWQMSADLIDPNVTLIQERVDEEEGLITRFFEQEVDLMTWQGQFRVKVVGRRFVEKERIIHIACMLMDPVELGGKRVDGLCIRRRVLDVVEAAPVSQLINPERPGTLKRSYIVVEPGVYDPQMPDEERREGVGLLTKFALLSGKMKCKEKHQYLENRLVDCLGKMTLNDDEQPAAERSDVLKRRYHDDTVV